ncbi:hypothetical protein [Nitrosomonas marina]|uniref:hypothetical protein n=1 Tax=Nitrosomonas marina TaxID=917 RepID=UPI0015A6106B|nr:hypothetical protein [Nitrosomonas marina]
MHNTAWQNEKGCHELEAAINRCRIFQRSGIVLAKSLLLHCQRLSGSANNL